MASLRRAPAHGRAGRGPAVREGQWHSPEAECFQLLELVAEAIANRALQEAGDVRVELAVLPLQRGDRDDDRGMQVPQLKNDFLQSRITVWRAPGNRATTPSFRPTAHHTEDATTH